MRVHRGNNCHHGLGEAKGRAIFDTLKTGCEYGSVKAPGQAVDVIG